MADVRLATRLSPGVDRRLRMLALVERRPLSRVLTELLDEALPAADSLAARLRDSQSAPAGAVA